MAPRASDGDGVELRRAFPGAELMDLDPFLLLDQPRYQDTASERIPVAVSADGKVRAKVIAGESLGVKGVIETRIPIVYLHATVAPGGEFTQAVPKTENAFAFVVEGEGTFGGRRVGQNQVALFDRAGENVTVRNEGSAPLSFLLIAGEPIGEPVARYGPFVMNSREELVQAADGFRNGRRGEL
jgi:redox-sensitive bicupin YhaK (pirin superfamily)